MYASRFLRAAKNRIIVLTSVSLRLKSEFDTKLVIHLMNLFDFMNKRGGGERRGGRKNKDNKNFRAI